MSQIQKIFVHLWNVRIENELKTAVPNLLRRTTSTDLLQYYTACSWIIHCPPHHFPHYMRSDAISSRILHSLYLCFFQFYLQVNFRTSTSLLLIFLVWSYFYGVVVKPTLYIKAKRNISKGVDGSLSYLILS